MTRIFAWVLSSHWPVSGSESRPRAAATGRLHRGVRASHGVSRPFPGFAGTAPQAPARARIQQVVRKRTRLMNEDQAFLKVSHFFGRCKTRAGLCLSVCSVWSAPQTDLEEKMKVLSSSRPHHRRYYCALWAHTLQAALNEVVG